MKKLLLLLFFATCIACPAQRKKFIAHGWDLLSCSPQILLENIDALEQLPLAGLSIRMLAKNDSGKTVWSSSPLVCERLKPEWLDHHRPALKRVCGGTLKDNFITTMWAPQKRLAWQDDEAWDRAANNLGVLMALAKEVGARGLLIDPEDYPKSKQYDYLGSADGGSYREIATLARKRGAQLMQAMGNAYPNGTLLAFWLFSLSNLSLYKGTTAPAQILETSGNLWYPFLEGMLDVVPEDFTMVDATENGYTMKFEDYDFYKAALNIQRDPIRFLSPENHKKYRHNVQVGFGLYLDMYTNQDPTKYYYHPPLNGSRVNRLYENVKQAMEASDEYCWLYGEQFHWTDWKTPPRKQAPSWESQLPGMNKVLAKLLDPQKVLAEQFNAVKQKGELKNLVTNSECAPIKPANAKEGTYDDWEAGNLPEGWHFWQHTKMGKFFLDTTTGYGDKYSARAEGIGSGCFLVKCPAAPSADYAVEAYHKGKLAASVRVRWQNQNKWVVPEKDFIFSFDEDAKDGWKKATGFVTVPHEADMMVVLLGCNLGPEDSANFDLPKVYKISQDEPAPATNADK